MNHDIEAEQVVLGAALLDASAAAMMTDRLSAADFYRPAHQVIFESVDALLAAGTEVGPVPVAAEARKHGRGVDAPYLHTLIASVPTVANAGWYAERVRALATLRHLGEAAARIGQLAREGDPDDCDDLIERARQVLDDAAARKVGQVASLAELMTAWVDAVASGCDTTGIDVPWVDLAAMVPRVRPGQLVTVAGRPGTGKSLILLALAAHAARMAPTLLVSLEMHRDELIARLAAEASRIPLADLVARRLDESQWAKLQPVYTKLRELETLRIDDSGAATVASIRRMLTEMRRDHRPPGLVVIDYLQLMSTGRRTESRQVEVADLSRSLKLLAKEFEVPILIGAQLNRGPEMRASKMPTIADLRESGGIENDSDVVMLLHRPDDNDPSRAGELDVIVGKNRNGATGQCALSWQPHIARIGNLLH